VTSQSEGKTLCLSAAVAQVVFGPTIVAYGFVAVDWRILGLCLYAFFMVGLHTVCICSSGLEIGSSLRE